MATRVSDENRPRKIDQLTWASVLPLEVFAGVCVRRFLLNLFSSSFNHPVVLDKHNNNDKDKNKDAGATITARVAARTTAVVNRPERAPALNRESIGMWEGVGRVSRRFVTRSRQDQ